jgi:single-stranded-DNA-specific exonuclease
MPIHDEWVLSEAPAPAGEQVFRSATLSRLAMDRAAGQNTPVDRFLSPSLDELHDGSGIFGMEGACDRIESAIRRGEQILIYGDYDVDGVTSIVLLSRVISYLGGQVDHVVPHRLFDGYGLKTAVLERVLSERSVRLIITVDCGITSVEPVERALARGIDVIVTDHHLPPELLPAATAVLNPKQPGCDYPFKDLAGVGVAFKLSAELLRRAGRSMSIASLVKIACLGTVADVAPLTGENRVIARVGLDGLADPRNPGLKALIRNLGLLGRPLRASDVGFKIGPRINAAGRLASADTAIRLFSARDEETAFPLVVELNRLNGQRRTIEKQVLAAAEEQIRRAPIGPVLVVAGDDWHKGVLGLCASRLAQQYHRPALVISRNGDECVGSGRSIAGVNLHAMLALTSGLFAHFGGHEYACGFAFESKRLPELAEALRSAAGRLDTDCFRRRIELDAQQELDGLDRQFFDDHQHLEPFGAGNRQPVFYSPCVEVVTTREFAEECLEVTFAGNQGGVRAVAWPSVRSLRPLLGRNARVDIAWRLEPDAYSASGFRLEIVDAAPAGDAPLRNESIRGSV